MKTLKIPLRAWQVKQELNNIWKEYADTGSQIVYRRILRRERELRQLRRHGG